MSDYKLILVDKNNQQSEFDLFPKENKILSFDHVLEDSERSRNIVNNFSYSLKVVKCGFEVDYKNLYIGEEPVDADTLKLLKSDEHLQIFRDCFLFITIEVVIGEDTYSTQYINVKMSKHDENKSICNMIDYISEKSSRYLLEDKIRSKIKAGIKPDSYITVEAQLNIINEIYETYVNFYSSLQFAAHKKLINAEEIGDFSRLHSIRSGTIRYIVNHPEELQAVNYNSGIQFHRQYYQPKNTLVNTVTYSYDTEENQIIVGFLKTVVSTLNNIKNDIIKQTVPLKNDEEEDYIDGLYLSRRKNSTLLSGYSETIDENISKFWTLYIKYKDALKVSGKVINSPPTYTSVFQNLAPYNAIFKEIVKWFTCGAYDFSKSNLLLSLISMSKIYECYCLLKLCSALEKSGYKQINAISHLYPENEYYKNTKYNNTFEYNKGDINITLYFQPIIFDNINVKESNNIHLIRNNSLFNSKEDNLFYTPDYILKVNCGENTNYYILDAKHSHTFEFTENRHNRLGDMILKYLFSISPTSKDSKLSGLCILCGRTNENKQNNLYDKAAGMNISVSPTASVISLSGLDTEDDDCLMEFIKSIEQFN